LILGDCLAVLPTLATGSVDAVITDPPYGAGIADWDTEPLRQDCLTEMLRVSTGPVLAFGSCYPEHMARVFSLTPPPQRVLIWNVSFSQSKARRNGMFYHWQPIYCWGLAGTAAVGTDVFRFPTDNIQHGFAHPGMKPLRLMRRLVSLFQVKTILDPYMGSGTTGVACVQTGRRFLGIEIDPAYFAIAEKRIAEAQLQMRMEFADAAQ